MSLFKPVRKPAKLKAGIFGETGTGKSYTAALIMAGLWKHCKAAKPIFLFDTEGGAGFIKDKIFDPQGIPTQVCESTAFNDLCEGLKESEREAFGVIIDQESRYWDEFRKQYMVDVNRKKRDNQPKQSYLTIADWGILKPKWAEYNYLYLNTDLHIIKIGRSANVFESSEQVVAGGKKTEFVKVGTKFKSESESGYEPSLLCEIEKVFVEGNGEYSRILHVVKDRFDIIDSKDFTNPTFADFLPHIQKLDLGGTQTVIVRPDSQIFDPQGDDILAQRGRRRGILCEELAALIASYLPGQDAKQKKAKADIVHKLFGVRAWKSVEDDWNAVPLDLLEKVYKNGENGDPSPAEKACIEAVEALTGEPAAS